MINRIHFDIELDKQEGKACYEDPRYFKDMTSVNNTHSVASDA